MFDIYYTHFDRFLMMPLRINTFDMYITAILGINEWIDYHQPSNINYKTL